MPRNLKNVAPHYYEILQQYRGGDKMIELEAFDMELKTADEVKELFLDVCSSPEEDEQPSSGSPQSEQEGTSESTDEAVNSILAIVGGEASFRALMDWATQNLTQEELGGLRETLESGDIDKIKETIIELQQVFNNSKNYESYKLF